MALSDWTSANATWLNTLAESVKGVYRMVTGAAYIIGAAFAFKALYSLKIYGELRTMMASQTSLKEPLTYLLVSAVFIYMPTALDILMSTAFGAPGILGYEQLPAELNLTSSNGGIALLRILQVIGAMAFVRGWVLIARSQGQGSQPGTLGKGMTHVFGGVLLMNIVMTVDVMYNSLGIKF